MSSLTTEIITTDWFNASALRLPDYKVGRVNFGQGRSYLKLTQDGELDGDLKLYTSLTTAINQAEPMADSLIDWYINHGREEAQRRVKVAQEYGTLMHLEIGKFLMQMSYDFNAVEEVVQDYLSENDFWEKECNEWATNLKSDMAAFCQWAVDYNVKPLGLEFVLLSDRWQFGTMIDLVCEITTKVDGLDHENPYKSGPRKGQPREVKVDKTIRACVNFKSGRKGFYRSNQIQINAEKALWEENFPDLPIDSCYNWSPKDWRKTPSYNFTDQTGKISEEEIDAVMALAKERYAYKAEEKEYTSISGTFSIADGGLDSVVRSESLEEHVRRRFSRSPDAAPTSGAKKAVYESGGLPF